MGGIWSRRRMAAGPSRVASLAPGRVARRRRVSYLIAAVSVTCARTSISPDSIGTATFTASRAPQTWEPADAEADPSRAAPRSAARDPLSCRRPPQPRRRAPGVSHRLSNRLALDRVAILQIEHDAADVRRADRDRRVNDVAELPERVDFHLHLVVSARTPQGLAPVGVVELRLQVVGGRLNRVGWNAGRLDLRVDPGHGLRIGALRFFRSARPALSSDLTQARSGAFRTDPSPVVMTTDRFGFSGSDSGLCDDGRGGQPRHCGKGTCANRTWSVLCCLPSRQATRNPMAYE